MLQKKFSVLDTFTSFKLIFDIDEGNNSRQWSVLDLQPRTDIKNKIVQLYSTNLYITSNFFPPDVLVVSNAKGSGKNKALDITIIDAI